MLKITDGRRVSLVGKMNKQFGILGIVTEHDGSQNSYVYNSHGVCETGFQQDNISMMKTITGTQRAFKEAISVRGAAKKLGLKSCTVSNWKKYIEAGEKISTDKMEEILLRLGSRIKKETTWEIPVKI